MHIFTTLAEIHQYGLWAPYFFSQFKYYTWWNLVLVILNKWTSKYIDLHMSCLIVAFVSFQLSYVYPCEYSNKIADGYILHLNSRERSNLFYLGDFITHWLPLLYVFLFVPVEPVGNKTVLTFFFILSFFMLIDAQDLYRGETGLCMVTVIIAVVLRLVF